MTLPYGIIRDELGRVLDFGGTKVTQEFSFLFGGSLPSGWGTSNASDAITTPARDVAAVPHDSSNDGAFRVGTSIAATAIDEVALLYGPALHMNRIKAAYFEVAGLCWNDSYVSALAADVTIGLRSIETAGAGVEVSQFGRDATARFRLGGVSGSDPTDAHYEMRTSGEANKRRTVGLLLVPGTQEVALTEGGMSNIVDWRRATNMAAGQVRPILQISALEAARKAFRFTALRLTVWQH